MITNTLLKLQELQLLFAVPHHWQQHSWARSKYDLPIGPSSENAVCWCLAGGIMKVLPDQDSRRFALERAVFDALPVTQSVFIAREDGYDVDRVREAIVNWNDHYARDAQDVQKVIAHAIAMEQTKEMQQP